MAGLRTFFIIPAPPSLIFIVDNKGKPAYCEVSENRNGFLMYYLESMRIDYNIKPSNYF